MDLLHLFLEFTWHIIKAVLGIGNGSVNTYKPSNKGYVYFVQGVNGGPAIGHRVAAGEKGANAGQGDGGEQGGEWRGFHGKAGGLWQNFGYGGKRCRGVPLFTVGRRRDISSRQVSVHGAWGWRGRLLDWPMILFGLRECKEIRD